MKNQILFTALLSLSQLTYSFANTPTTFVAPCAEVQMISEQMTEAEQKYNGKKNIYFGAVIAGTGAFLIWTVGKMAKINYSSMAAHDSAILVGILLGTGGISAVGVGGYMIVNGAWDLFSSGGGHTAGQNYASNPIAMARSVTYDLQTRHLKGLQAFCDVANREPENVRGAIAHLSSAIGRNVLKAREVEMEKNHQKFKSYVESEVGSNID